MSGQPYRYASDVENFRKEYMNTLGMRANIDVMNYQANKNYLETGTLPPRSQMKDTRSTSDILMDTEKLKLSIVKDLQPIASPNMAMAIIQRVQSSPLNGDGSFFVWLAQNTPELVAQIKKKYKFGIAGNENDVATMVLFLQSIYSKTKDMNSTVKSAFDRPIASTGNLAPRDYSEIKSQFDSIYLKLIATRPLTPLLKQVKERLDAMKDIFIPVTRYNQIQDMYLNMSNINPANPGYLTALNSLGYKEWIEYNQDLPNPVDVKAVLSQLQKSELNANATLSLRILQNLLSLFPSVRNSRDILALSDNLLATVRPGGPPMSQTAATVFTTPPAPAPIATPAGRAQDIGDNVASTILTGLWRLYDENKDAPNDAFDFSQGVLDELATTGITGRVLAVIGATPANIKLAVSDYTKDSINTLGQLINGEDPQTFVAREIPAIKGVMRLEGMVGFGLKRRGRPRGSGLLKPITERIDKTKGIKQGAVQIPFGKYIVNKNKLDNDIFYILDGKKGYGIKGYPQKKVSSALGSVVRTIIGGGVPKFEELQNLDDLDKEYLHKVASKAGILDKLSIPVPSKDKLEKDIHEFEVMKGEILAGNDSSELIKKFKLLLLRLSKNGSIPKRETVEIMEDLISLGY